VNVMGLADCIDNSLAALVALPKLESLLASVMRFDCPLPSLMMCEPLIPGFQANRIESATVLARNYIEQGFVHCWVVGCCLALEAVVFAVVALRYVTLILKHEDCKVEFHDGSALCNPSRVLVGDKRTDRAPTDRYQLRYCEEF